jgi:predicted MFS family arabinose efflux permease
MNRLFFLAAGMFALGCEDYLFEGLLPGISESLGTSVVAAAQGGVFFGLGYIFAVPLCALLLSRVSARSVLKIALASFLAGNALSLIGLNLISYIISRFLSGLGGGLFLPVAIAASAQLVDASHLGRALGLMWAANCAGAVAGVPVGLWLAHNYSWRASVLLILILASIVLLGIVFRKQELKVDSPPPSLGEQFRLLLDRRVVSIVGVSILTATGCLGLYSFLRPSVLCMEHGWPNRHSMYWLCDR